MSAAPSFTLGQVRKLKPCAPDMARIETLLKPRRRYTAAEARAAGCTFDDLVWVASKAARTSPDIERRVRLWLADCAEHVLHIFERAGPNDDRPRKAIQAARDYANGLIDAAAWIEARAAARAAAWDAAWDAEEVGAAARAAAWDAAWDAEEVGAAARAAARAAGWDEAWDAAWDARDAAWAARAARDAARAAEEAWQFDRLIYWLSDAHEARMAAMCREWTDRLGGVA